MPDDVTAAGELVFELFGACAAAPDDQQIGRRADDALGRLEALLLAAEPVSAAEPVAG